MRALGARLLAALLVDEVVEPQHGDARREGVVGLVVVAREEAVDALAPLGQLLLVVLARVAAGPAVGPRHGARRAAADGVLDAERAVVVDRPDDADAAVALAARLLDGDDVADLDVFTRVLFAARRFVDAGHLSACCALV